MQAQSGRLLLSHAVPPTATFSGPPCSLRWKEQDTTYRQTCFVTSDRGHRLHSITSQGNNKGNTSSVELPASASSVVELDISRHDASTSITVLQSDGTLTVISKDFKTVAVGKLSLKEEAHTNILAASVLDLASARKSVLRARADIYGSLSDDARIVVAATGSIQNGKRRSVCYVAWAIVPTFSPTANRVKVSHLFEHNLSQLVPALADVDINVLDTYFGPRFAFVDFRSSQGLLRFDLQSATPRPTVALDELSAGISSYVAISQAHALARFPGKLRIIDLNYSTVQSSLDQNRKRKRDGQNLPARTHLICHFSRMNRVIARDGFRLLAIDLTPTSSSDGRKPLTSTLADNISRGMAVRSQLATDLLVAEANIGGTLQQQDLPHSLKQSLSDLLDKDDVNAFEDALMERFFQEANGLHGANAVSEDVVNFVLSALFTVQLPTEDQVFQTRLHLKFLAPTLISTLNRRGLLRLSKLRRALRLGKEQSSSNLRHDDIAKALVNADHSFALLSRYAATVANPVVHEQTTLLRLLLHQVLLVDDEAHQPRILAAESSEEMTAEASAVATSGRPTELSILENCLITVMEQYSNFEVASISSSIRSILSSDEIFGVVQLLRQQMFRGGHTGSALTLSEDPATSPEQRVSLKAAVNILSACLDATGPLDLISGEQEDKLIERIIPDLLSEISLATQYIEESADLQGILRETLRYAESHQPQGRGQKALESTKLKGGRVGEIATLYAQRTEDEELSGLPGALPLSLRADEAIKATKVRRGGGQTKGRSVRETLMLESRQMGPYRFERLVL